MTKREKESHKKLEEEAQNRKLTKMLIMKLEQRHLREKQKNSSKRAKALPLPCAQSLHFREKREPGSRPEMTTPVFIKPMPGSGVLLGYPETFTEADVVVYSFVFTAHFVEYLGVFPVNGPIAVFFVSN